MTKREIKRIQIKLEEKFTILLNNQVKSYFNTLDKAKLAPTDKQAMVIFQNYNQKWKWLCEQNNPGYIIRDALGQPYTYFKLDGFAFVKALETITKQLKEQQEEVSKKGEPVKRKSKPNKKPVTSSKIVKKAKNGL